MLRTTAFISLVAVVVACTPSESVRSKPSPSDALRKWVVFVECPTPCDENVESTRLLTAAVNGPDVEVLVEDGYGINSGPTWSPDGTRVAFARGSENGSDDDSDEIWVISADGTDLVRMTRDSLSSEQPAWSPDGTEIAYVNEDWENAEIVTINVDTGESAQLTENDVQESSPAWSPDGSKIIFIAGDGDGDDIYAMDSNGSAREPVLATPHLTEESPEWSPDGSSIAFSRWTNKRGWQLFTMRSDGTQIERLTKGGSGNNRGPSFSPDGRWIVFSRGEGWSLFKVRIDGSDLKRLHGRKDSLFFSPDWKPAS